MSSSSCRVNQRRRRTVASSIRAMCAAGPAEPGQRPATGTAPPAPAARSRAKAAVSGRVGRGGHAAPSTTSSERTFRALGGLPRGRQRPRRRRRTRGEVGTVVGGQPFHPLAHPGQAAAYRGDRQVGQLGDLRQLAALDHPQGVDLAIVAQAFQHGPQAGGGLTVGGIPGDRAVGEVVLDHGAQGASHVAAPDLLARPAEGDADDERPQRLQASQLLDLVEEAGEHVLRQIGDVFTGPQQPAQRRLHRRAVALPGHRCGASFAGDQFAGQGGVLGIDHRRHARRAGGVERGVVLMQRLVIHHTQDTTKFYIGHQKEQIIC